jgi:ribulose-5-phosphate 4-epimerase/fuculose-1-phosphate aldolase
MFSKRRKLPGTAVDRVNETYKYLLGKKKDPSQQVIESSLNREVRDALVPAPVRDQVVSYLRLLAKTGICAARMSEASFQLDQDQYLVTRRGCWFLDLDDEDLYLALTGGGQFQDEEILPQHWDWHQEIFRKNSQINTVILAQPPAALVLAGRDQLPDQTLLEVPADTWGEIIICQPTSEDISRGAEVSKMILVPGSGVLSLGSSLEEAAANLDLVNRISEITLKA